MPELETRAGADRATVTRDVVAILYDLLSDWEGFEGEIGPHTRLVADLACSSIEIVELAVTIEDHFAAPNLPFHQLLMTPGGDYVDDLRVDVLIDFVCRAVGEPTYAERADG